MNYAPKNGSAFFVSLSNIKYISFLLDVRNLFHKILFLYIFITLFFFFSVSKANQYHSIIDSLHFSQDLAFECHYRFKERGSPDGSVVKNPHANTGDAGSVPELGRSPGEGNGNPLQYYCLENPVDRGDRWARVHGVTKELKS